MTHVKKGLTLTLLILFGLADISPACLHAATLVSDQASSPSSSSAQDLSVETNSMTDQKAKVFNVEGNVEILRAETEEWIPLSEQEDVREGDRIRTESNASADIYYDEYYLNFVRVEPDTELTFSAIEPTRIDLDQGGIFNNLDGLISGTEYEVATPTSVAAVRGTRFMREFNEDDFADNTLVSEGNVDLNPFLSDGKTLDRENSFQVGKNQAVAFDRDVFKNRDFNRVKAQAFEPEQRDKMKNMRSRAAQSLEKKVGNKKLNEAKKKFTAFKKDPKRVREAQTRLQQKVKGPTGERINNRRQVTPNQSTKKKLRLNNSRDQKVVDQNRFNGNQKRNVSTEKNRRAMLNKNSEQKKNSAQKKNVLQKKRTLNEQNNQQNKSGMNAQNKRKQTAINVKKKKN